MRRLINNVQKTAQKLQTRFHMWVFRETSEGKRSHAKLENLPEAETTT